MRLLFSTIACLLIVGFSAIAETVEYKYQTGACDGQSAGWWSITTITGGVPTRITGIGCDGKLYDKELTRPRFVSADPMTGFDVTLTGSCDAAVWRVVIQRDNHQRPLWMSGQGCDGRYWVIDDFTEPVPGGNDLE